MPKAVAVQFLYAFVVDADGLKVLDIKDLQVKGEVRIIDSASVSLRHAKDIYLARTYAYVANGEDGIAIIDIERPESPKLEQMFNDEWKAQRRAFGKSCDDERKRLCLRRRW